ncbi:hypothetical protein AMTR_s00066p00195370 [Amborella trichopoda]|uniref:Uncharacterized protein n=1 Tax=Amborella trichopoda TaxID=13333 RepID=U5DFT9_AMBTC|nr:hypothetical protein AMTR_s00066p00195370 [Amborella trichopoda]
MVRKHLDPSSLLDVDLPVNGGDPVKDFTSGSIVNNTLDDCGLDENDVKDVIDDIAYGVYGNGSRKPAVNDSGVQDPRSSHQDDLKRPFIHESVPFWRVEMGKMLVVV